MARCNTPVAMMGARQTVVRRWGVVELASVAVVLCGMLQCAAAEDVFHGAAEDYKVTQKVIAIAIIPLGLAVMFAGCEHLKACISVLAFFVCGGIFFLVGQACAADTSAESAVAIACGAVFAVAGAAITWKFEIAQRVGTGLVGGGAGAVLAMYANMTGLHKLDASNPHLPFYVLVAALPVLGFIATAVANRYGACIALAIMGSFAMVRGIGVFVGGFVDPVTLVASPGPLHNSAAMPWVYVGCIPAFAVLSAVWQCWRMRRKLKREEDEADGYLAHHKLFTENSTFGPSSSLWYQSTA